MENQVSREEFKEVKEDIGNLYEKSNKHDRQISVLETLVENLKGLPSAINSLERTMTLMGHNLENLNCKVDKMVEDEEKHRADEAEQREILAKQIDRLDEKSKVDILSFLKSNWWSIVSTLALIGILVQQFLTK